MGRIGQSEPPLPKLRQLGATDADDQNSDVLGDFSPTAASAPNRAAQRAPTKKRPNPLIGGRPACKSRRDMLNPAAKRIIQANALKTASHGARVTAALRKKSIWKSRPRHKEIIKRKPLRLYETLMRQ